LRLSIQKEDLRIVVKRSMVLALFYVVAIRPIRFYQEGGPVIKSVHYQAPKIKHFYKLENRFTFGG
jgi:hypothetical protein